MTMTELLTFDVLKEAVKGTAAAFRRAVDLQPAGGTGSKVYPPTYEGGRYATEKRRINAETVDCVLLDSVQSQANRMESALYEEWSAKPRRMELPVISVDFSQTEVAYIGKITSLQVPHRIADAILRDSAFDGIPFRQTDAGRILDEVSVQNATGLFKYCPTALIFGLWDSTSLRGGLHARFGRTIVSEIIGIGSVAGQSTSSRIDPLQITSKSAIIYKTTNGNWTLDPVSAVKDQKGNPVKFGKKGEGKPSVINHGNVKPAFTFAKEGTHTLRDKDGNPVPVGGFTIDRALHTTTISLPAIRRLKFPTPNGEQPDNSAVHTALVALALCGSVLFTEQGYDLRSRCLLLPEKESFWELVDKSSSSPVLFTLTSQEAKALLSKALAAIPDVLKWQEAEFVLQPRSDLVKLVKNSQAQGAEPDEDEEG
jgi:CRISPR-associated protein Csb1